jgi:hypothetical protein
LANPGSSTAEHPSYAATDPTGDPAMPVGQGGMEDSLPGAGVGLPRPGPGRGHGRLAGCRQRHSGDLPIGP